MDNQRRLVDINLLISLRFLSLKKTIKFDHYEQTNQTQIQCEL